FNYYNASRKPFPSDIEHFRNEASVACSVINHKLFDPDLSGEFSGTKLTARKWSRSKENGLMAKTYFLN
ncbi:MAG: hypothetical protein JSV60_03695, partial [Desulfobacterales bacterium]